MTMRYPDDSSNIIIDGGNFFRDARGLEIPGADARFERAVFDLLRQIDQRKVGQLILEAIRRTSITTPAGQARPGEVRIVPAESLCESVADAAVGAGATPRGQAEIGCESGRPTGVVGTGQGSDVNLPFRVNRVAADGEVCAPEGGAGLDPDAALLHELVHALRALRGVLLCVPTQEAFDNLEEFIAIAVVNVYLAEPPRPRPLRQHHQGFPVWNRQAEPGWFYPDRAIGIRFMQVPPFLDVFNLLANIPPGTCPFNPVRDYMLGTTGRLPALPPRAPRPSQPAPPDPVRLLRPLLPPAGPPSVAPLPNRPSCPGQPRHH
jgi:hypothetical protein